MSDCKNCTAGLISIGGMYDMHLFTSFKGETVDEVIAAWEEHNASPNPALVGERKVEDLGKAYLCPVIVMTAERKELRRVGKMVFPDTKKTIRDLLAWRAAVVADSDVVRLMKEGAYRR